MIELACETDFVAKSDKFIALGNTVLQALADSGAETVEAALATKAGSGTVESTIADEAAILGEKIELRRLVRLPGNKFAVYLHRTSKDLPPQVGVVDGRGAVPQGIDGGDGVAGGVVDGRGGVAERVDRHRWATGRIVHGRRHPPEGVGPAGQGTDRGDELGVGGVQIGLDVAAEHLGDTGVGRRHHASEHRGLEHDANVGARGAVADSARVELGELIEHAVEDRDEGAVRRRTATTTAPTTR